MQWLVMWIVEVVKRAPTHSIHLRCGPHIDKQTPHCCHRRIQLTHGRMLLVVGDWKLTQKKDLLLVVTHISPPRCTLDFQNETPAT